jgi:hypothetical protein
LNNEDIEHVISLELALLDPEVRRSRERVEDMLDPDFREIGASGHLWTRGEMVTALTGDDAGDEHRITASEVHGVLVSPGLVLLTYVSHAAGRSARRSSLWRQNGGVWRLLFHQGTVLGEPLRP